MRRVWLCLLCSPLTACLAFVGPSGRAPDAGQPDAGDAGVVTDAGGDDAGGDDAGFDDGGPTDAGFDAGVPDSGAPDAGGPDAGLWTGGYIRGPVNFDVQAPAGPRRTSLDYVGPDTWASVFTDVQANGEHRTRIHTVRYNGGTPAIGGGQLLDDAVAVNTLEPTVTGGADTQGPLVLVAWEDAREGAGNGHREIYAQFLRTDAAGAVTLVGGNFDVTQEPVLEEYSPCIGFDPSQGFLLAWSDTREVATRPEGRVVFARFITPAGAVGPELRLGDSTSRWQSGCAAAGGGGHIAVAWWDYVPLGGTACDIAYKVRFFTGGAMGPELTITREGNITPDPPAVAWNSRRDEFLVVYMAGSAPREVHGALYRSDGTVRRSGLRVGVHPEGSAVPSVAYSARTDSYLVTWHAMTSNDAYAQELNADADPVGAAQSVNASPPTLGTFYAPVAASTSGDRFLVTPMHNFNQVGGTFFNAP